MVHQIVYLPIELKHRELDSRLITAAHLVEQGVTVVLGQQWAIFQNFRFWPRGVILFKTVNGIQAHNMALFTKTGHVVAATDEEVLTYMRDFCIAFTPQAAENCHVFFAQSQIHANTVAERFPHLRDKIVVTGNPRIEMTSRFGRQAFQAEADRIRSETGPYILFNTNFASINSIWGELQSVFNLVLHAGLIDRDDPNKEEIFKSWVEWENNNFAHLSHVLVWAAANVKSHRIILRPHPGERIEHWERLVGNSPNVTIVPKSPPMPWIMASDLLIHTSCTTGLEAVLLDKPALNIEPYQDPAGDRITGLVNPTVKSSAEAIPAMAQFLASGGGIVAENDKCLQALEQYFPHYHEGGAAEAIAQECINQLKAGRAPIGQPFDWGSVGQPFGKRPRDEKSIEKFTTSKQEVMSLLQGIKDRLGLKRPTTLSQIDDSLFVFSPKA